MAFNYLRYAGSNPVLAVQHIHRGGGGGSSAEQTAPDQTAVYREPAWGGARQGQPGWGGPVEVCLHRSAPSKVIIRGFFSIKFLTLYTYKSSIRKKTIKQDPYNIRNDMELCEMTRNYTKVHKIMWNDMKFLTKWHNMVRKWHKIVLISNDLQ